MLILQALLLWLIVAALMIGGAMLFHRFFREESPWLGFIVPPLALVALLNFIEHFLALPNLLLLLPLLLGGTVWMAVGGRYFEPELRLPVVVFLFCFAFTFAVRFLQPDIAYTSDGVSDLNMINNFLQGQTVPPPDTWMPPFRFEWYYDLQHYAASVVDRLLGVKIGTADNVSHALLNALVAFMAAACAHRLAEGRLFATFTLPLLVLSAATGSAAYLLLFAHNNDLWLPFDLSSGMANPPNANPLWAWLAHDLPAGLQGKSPAEILDHQTLRLQVPGFWTWRDEYHANASGHLLTLLSVFIVAELAAPRRTIWPWVLGAVMPILATTTSAWALPITTLLCWPMLGVALYLGRRPGPWPVALWSLFAAVTLLWPAFYNATSNPQVPDIQWINPLDHVPLNELLVQWWPILALIVCAATFWPELSFASRWMLLVVPIMLIGIDSVTIESRYNTIEKMWGYTWAVGLAGLYPLVVSRDRADLETVDRLGGYGAFYQDFADRVVPVFRLVVLAILLNGAFSLYAFSRSALGGLWNGAAGHLAGDHYLTSDEQKHRLLEVVGEKKRAVFLCGKCAYCYNEAPALTVFTGNLSYIAWSWFETHASDASEAKLREKLNNDFYSGALRPFRLGFLRANHVAGVVIWPDDAISDGDLATLESDLAPDFTYVDCKGEGTQNAGVFLRQF